MSGAGDDDTMDEAHARLALLQADMNEVFQKHLPDGVQYTMVTLTPEEGHQSFKLDVCSTLDNRLLRAVFQILVERYGEAYAEELTSTEIIKIPPKGDMH